MQSVALSLILQYTCIGAAEFFFVERVTVFLCSLSYFFINLFFVFSNLIFNQDIGTITFLRIAVVNQWVIERINVS